MTGFFLDGMLLFLAGVCVGLVIVLPVSPWLSPELHPLALVLSIAWLAWRVMALDRILAHRRAWSRSTTWHMDADALPVAASRLPWDYAWLLPWLVRRIPAQEGLFLGKAFRWDGTHTQQLETALAQHGALPVAANSRGGHPALHAVGAAEEEPLVLPWSELGGHTGITGTTGSGKTTGLILLAHEAIRACGAVVVFDPKGERGFLAHVADAAKRAGKRFVLLSPAFPHQSACINILGTATTPAEISMRIQALMPSAGGRTNDPFFEQFPLAFLERLATAQHALGCPWTLESLYPAAVLLPHMERLLADYLTHLGAHTTGKLSALIGEYQKHGPPDLTADALIDDWHHNREHFQKITASLIPAFRGLIGPPLGPLFSAETPDITWQQIVDEECVVYIALASMLLGETANRIGRVLLQDLIGFIGRQYAYTDTAKAMSITVIIDELRQVLYPNFLTTLEMSRGAGARFILAQQSLAAGEYALGKPAAKVMAANLNTKIWFRIADDDDSATVATEGIGQCTVRLPETGVGLSYGGVGGLSGSSHRRLASREVPLIRSQWLTALPRGEFFIRTKGEIFKGRSPLLSPISPSTLQELGLSALWDSMKLHP